MNKDVLPNVGRENELEAQITELLDTLEILTLDKEQLVLDNELLQARIEENDLIRVGTSAKDSEQSSLSAENGKLREALRRLHSQSTSDKSLLDALNEKQTSDEIELISLRKYQALAKDEITELKELVDSASSYESMIESLTTKNIEYSQAVAQLESTVRDLEDQQELSEELDQQQRADLDISRKEQDSLRMQIYERDAMILSQEMKIEELKKINDRFRRQGESQKDVMDVLKSQVNVSAAESERMQARARAAVTSHLQQTELKDKVLALSAEIHQSNTSKYQLEATYARIHSIFSRCSLFVEENALCVREVRAVGCATQGSAVTHSMVQLFIRLLGEDRTFPDRRSSLSSKNYRDAETEGGPFPSKSPVAKIVDAAVLRRAIVLVRATCVSWHCAAFILTDSSDSNTDGSLTSVVVTLRDLFQSMWTALSLKDRSTSSSGSEGDSADPLSAFEVKLFNDIESVTLEAERLLQPFMAGIGINALPALPSFTASRKGSVVSGELDEAMRPYNALSEGEKALRRFHQSCQSSYLMLASDVLVAFIETRMSQAMHSSTPILSPLTPEDDKGQFSKSATLPLNSGVIGDLCRTIRSELDSLGFLAPGHVVNVSTKRTNESSGEYGGTTITSGGGSDVIRSCTLGVFDSLLDLVLNSKGPGADEVTASPAQLRDCLSKITSIKSLISIPKGNSRVVDLSSEHVTMLNISSSTDAKQLWQSLTAMDQNVSDESDSHDIPGNEWGRLSVWRGRSRVHRDVLAAWETSQGELVSLRAGIKDAQRELQARGEELRAAKAANSAMGNILALHEQEQQEASSSLTIPGALSPRARFSDALPSPPNGDVAKLKAEIEVLTSALTVLEIQFEGAERENKRIRNAGRASDTMTPSKAVATLAEMVRAWRGIASHRLMASMIPLPQPVLFPLTKHTPVIASSQLTVDVAADVDEATVAATAVPDAQSVSALQVYRELRKLRSTIRVNFNKSACSEGSLTLSGCHNHRGGNPNIPGRESRIGKSDLIEKYTKSILLCGGSIVY